MPSPTAENYLKALLTLSIDGRGTGEVAVTDLAAALAVSKPAANSMVKSLAAQGHVAYERYRPVRLTPAGRTAAALIVRKHRLTEMFLVDQMGFAWDEVHAIAEQVEHIQSPAFFARMDELMGYPTTDPHGAPIPSPSGEIDAPVYASLAEAAPDACVVVRAVRTDAEEVLRRLTEHGIRLGTVLQRVPLGSAASSREAVRVRLITGDPTPPEVQLSREVAAALLVAPTQQGAPAVVG